MRYICWWWRVKKIPRLESLKVEFGESRMKYIDLHIEGGEMYMLVVAVYGGDGWCDRKMARKWRPVKVLVMGSVTANKREGGRSNLDWLLRCI